MGNILSYTADLALIAFAFFTNKIVLAFASVGFLSLNSKEVLIESKEIIGLVVVALTLVKLIIDIKKRSNK